MDQELVYGKLLSAGYELERTIHKQGTNQSHGRWEVRSAAARFEVHLGYKDNKSPPNPLVDTIVQGLKRWRAEVLDDVAASLEQACAAAQTGFEGGLAIGETRSASGRQRPEALVAPRVAELGTQGRGRSGKSARRRGK